MDLQLQDKKALVTGSTAGIGFAIAAALAREGAQVVVNGRTEQRVSEAQKRIPAENPNQQVEGVAADLSSAEGAHRLIDGCPEVDILVNNVGIFEPRPFEQIPRVRLMTCSISRISPSAGGKLESQEPSVDPFDVSIE